MWIFTVHGFYSAVCARIGNGERNQPVDHNRIMVRARLKSHLNNLKNAFPDLLEKCEIETFTGTDYKYRIFVSKDTWTTLLEKISEDINYDNFKSAVAKNRGVGSDYEHSLHDVWSTMYSIQK